MVGHGGLPNLFTKELVLAGRRVDAAFPVPEVLLERGHEAGELLPWFPTESMPGWKGFFSISARKAVSQGLTFRALEDTAKATFMWDQMRDEVPLEAGLTEAQEARLLDEWSETHR